MIWIKPNHSNWIGLDHWNQIGSDRLNQISQSGLAWAIQTGSDEICIRLDHSAGLDNSDWMEFRPDDALRIINLSRSFYNNNNNNNNNDNNKTLITQWGGRGGGEGGVVFFLSSADWRFAEMFGPIVTQIKRTLKNKWTGNNE